MRINDLSSSSPEITLQSNSAMQEIYTALSTIPVCQESVTDAFLNTIGKRKIEGPNIQGRLLEIHVQEVIQKLSLIWSITQQLPIQNGDETENFLFQSGDTLSSVVVSNRHTHQIYTEYDAVLLSTSNVSSRSFDDDRLPIVIEATSHTRGELYKHVDINTIKVKHKFYPLSEYFKTTIFGYIIVLLSFDLTKQSKVFKSFLNRGGVVVSVPLEYEEIATWTKEVSKKIRS